MTDSSITKLALSNALKELPTEQPFEKISISDICDRCRMNRKSFYYHFRDKYDLVNWIFDTEFMELNRLHALDSRLLSSSFDDRWKNPSSPAWKRAGFRRFPGRSSSATATAWRLQRNCAPFSPPGSRRRRSSSPHRPGDRRPCRSRRDDRVLLGEQSLIPCRSSPQTAAAKTLQKLLFFVTVSTWIK